VEPFDPQPALIMPRPGVDLMKHFGRNLRTKPYSGKFNFIIKK
jgi:hypothetical protein